MNRPHIVAWAAHATCLLTLVAVSTARAQEAAPAPAGAASAPSAPEDNAAKGAKLQEVVVSARRTRENPQRVPISINAFTPEALQKEDVRTSTDLEKNVPGLTICCGKGRALYNFVRGIQGVQSYFAETPMLGVVGGATSLAGSSMYFDLENLSVLKGPQGTLFGVSTNGGALLFAPKKPTDFFEGYFSGEMGNYGRRIIEGVVNVPVNDRLKFRVGVQSAFVDGYVTDQTSGAKLGKDDYTVGRLAVNFKPVAGVENDLFVNQYTAKGTLPPFVPVAINPNGAARATIGSALDTYIAQQQAAGYYSLIGLSTPARTENVNDVHQTNIANITSWRISDTLILRNIIGYTRLYINEYFDADGTPYRIYDNNVAGGTPPGSSQGLSEEVQVQGKTLGGLLDYTAGFFYARSKPGTPSTVIADLSDAFGIQTSTRASTQFDTKALYAQGTYDLAAVAKGLKATAGYRFTIDNRSLKQSSSLIIPSIALVLPNPDLDLHSKSKKGSYTLGLTYQATPRTMYYFTNSKGFLNGGFNTNVTNATDAPYGPESLNNFELGVKSDFNIGGMRARANLAGVYGLYEDAQVSVTTLVNAGTPQQTFAVLTRNAAKGVVRGLEWEFTLVPSSAFQFNFFGAYLRNKYTEWKSTDPATGAQVDLSSTPFVFVPKLKYGVTAVAYLPVSEDLGEMSVNATYTHQDKVVTTAVQNPQWYDMGPAIDNLNLGYTWDTVMGKRGLTASLFVNNVLQNKNANGGFGAYSSLGVVGYSPAVPRMWGLRLRQAF